MTDASPLSLAVIGHVNHGKTALVRALTGIETDRLPEEQARGLSIALGFAWRDYPAGGVDFLDAPGHEDFIRAMVMGTAGAQAALLVISATEGFQRQTREHLRIAGLLGLRAGLVAVTKADLLSPEDRPGILELIARELAGTFLAGAPVVFCSSLTGLGLDSLHDTIQSLVQARSPLGPLPGAYMPLDRVFSVTGAGTVVTGTLQGGPLIAGEEAVLLPSGRRVHLRQLQVHGQSADAVLPGGRVAAGLRGVSAGDLKAGEVLCAPDAYETGMLVDAEIGLASDAARPLRSGDEVRVLWGARQDMARVRLVGPVAIAPGERGLAQLRFHLPVVAYAGQHVILRRPSPAETIGGGTVLDPVAPPFRARTLDMRRALLEAAAGGSLDSIAAELSRRDGGAVFVREAARLARRSPPVVRDHLALTCETLDGDTVATHAAIAEARRAYLDQVAGAHRAQPARAWIAVGGIRSGLAHRLSRDLVAHVERRLSADGEIRLEQGQVALRDHDPFAALSPAALIRLQQIEAAFRAGGMTPPEIGALVGADDEDRALFDLLVEAGRLVSLRNVALRQTLAFHAEALDAAVETLRAAFPPPVEFTTGEARAVLETSRKFIVPALEFLDGRGDVVRRGDVRQVAPAENRFGVPRNPP